MQTAHTYLVFLLFIFGEVIAEAWYKEPLEPVDTRFFGYDKTKAYENFLQLEDVFRMEELLNITLDYWSRPSTPKENVRVFLQKKFLAIVQRFLDRKNIKHVNIERNLDEEIRRENAPHGGYIYNPFTGYDYGRYHNNDEANNEIRKLVTAHSNLATLFSLGHTYENRNMWAVKISAKKEPNRKLFFFMCGIHAREWVTVTTCMYMLNQMLTQYNKDQSVTSMLNKMDWVILPVTNVDGYVYSWKNSYTRLWRKTRSKSQNGCIGADPNRNFAHMWGTVGASASPCSETYKGKKAFSEDCVSNVARYLHRNKGNLAGFADIHAFSQLWMTPWGYTKRYYPNDYDEQNRVARAAVRALYNKHRTSYKYGPSSIVIYPTSGASDDWVYGVLGIKYSYGLELRDKGRYGFVLPSQQIIPTAEETFEGFKAMANEMKL